MQPQEHRIVIPPWLLPRTRFTAIELMPEGGSILASTMMAGDDRSLGVGLIARRLQEEATN
jgi:hypothetical protein